MYNSLTGKITEKGLSQLCLQVGGTEWILLTSLNTLDSCNVGEEKRLFTYLQHKEDSMTLFGFATKDERFLFLDLIKVNGVGAKAAQKILSGIKPMELIQCLDDEDVDRLCKIPGLGKKTAQKIVLALKGKLKLEDNVVKESSRDSVDKEILDSLVAMGFDKKKAKAVLVDIITNSKTSDEGEILRLSIIKLST
ncbi:Holliday junction branch migration protein RuvA [Thiospirochaeta perfilievii]|uniref:Holliday junction branch migration complex subunit RuvA n=1 Tax=Thiospirochaeta perfilievii TaxID=252967 RepID=A0A5C1Q9G6_9SPIO|nr:Holliday junction branch migration protein RuvA [Thiospirochaeta perfilievii]QEN03284.1 Holliday junction branch migration protein RuvA [Thiospirochaeta perfilievii]